MNREEAIAVLKEIAENKRFTFEWISLVNGKIGYEIHIKPEQGDSASLKPIFENRNLLLKEAKGILVVYREHGKSQ